MFFNFFLVISGCRLVWLSHWAWIPEVVGSNPTIQTRVLERGNMINLIILPIVVITGLFISSIVVLSVWLQERAIRRNYEIEQAEYMKEHPDSYGIGEL